MLTGKTAIITGGGRGIGKAIALKLSALGANVVINDIPSSQAAVATADEINAAGGHAIAVLGDVSVLEDMEKVAAETFRQF